MMVLRTRWVAPVSTPPIHDGFVAVHEGHIASVGQFDPLEHRGVDVIDLGDALLTPGFVNPHTHLELTCYAGKLPRGPLWPWIGKLVALRVLPGQRGREQAGVREGAWASLRAGVTCVGDISRLNIAWSVLQEVPIRKVCFVELLSIAAEPPRDPAELRDALAAIETGDLLTVGISPHAPYTVTAGHYRAAIELAAELGVPWTTHWAETPEEAEFLAGDTAALPHLLRPLQTRVGLTPPETSPMAYLASFTEGGPDGSLAHLNYVTQPEEIELLAASGHTAIYCPRAHHYFGHAPHPFLSFLDAGVPVAIGTDSLASNESLSILDELSFIAKVPGVRDRLTAHDLLRLGTLAGAQALGLDSRVGSIEKGKLADLAAFACSPGSADPVLDLIREPESPIGVWVLGERIV